MENRMNFNMEMEDVKSQFKMLTDKIEQENIISNQQIQEVGKGRILKYVLRNMGISIIMFCILSPYILWKMLGNGYPAWTYFSVVYMLIQIVLIKLVGYKREKNKIRKMGYDVVQYTEELKWLHIRSKKSKIIIWGMFIPVIVHLAFFAKYIVLAGQQLYGNQIWWIYVATLIMLIFVMRMSFGKTIDKITVMVRK